MKKTNFRISGITTLLLAMAILFSGCGLNKMVRDYEDEVSYSPNVNPLENHGGIVAVEGTGRIADGYFHRNAVAEITPVLRYGDSETRLEPVVLRGQRAEKDGILVDGALSIDYSDEVEFTEEMLASELFMSARIYMDGDEEDAEILHERKVADGIINTSQRVEKDEDMALAAHGYEEGAIATKSANIYFEYQRHNLNWNFDLNQREDNKEKIKEINEFLKKGWDIKSIEVNAWASPEGEVAFNEKLAKDRASTAHGYWEKQLEKGVEKVKEKLEKEAQERLEEKVEEAKEEAEGEEEIKVQVEGEYKVPGIQVASKGEDFEGFMEKLQASTIEEKDAIANVINSELAPEEREERIKDMTVIYEEIEEILKPLRRAEIVIEAVEPTKSDEEIATLSTTSPEELDSKELLYAATLTDDLQTKLEIYNSAKELFPQNYKGFNNAAYVNIKLENAEEAAADLEKANQLAPNQGSVLNNLGVVAAHKGDHENAISYYEAAEELGVNTNYNIGNIMILAGDYEDALSYYAGRTCTHNIGLAHMMNDNMSAAMTNLECADESAAVAYLTAIAGARENNNTMVFENLEKAIELDPDYKESAKIDREFIDLFGVAEFQEIVGAVDADIEVEEEEVEEEE